MSVRWVRIGDVLHEEDASVTVSASETYPIAGVLAHGRGLLTRPAITGAETSYSRLRRIRSGQVIFSRLKAFEGALAVVDHEHDGMYASHEFPTFRVDESAVNLAWMAHLLHCSWFGSAIAGRSRGVGARRERLSAEDFLSIEFPLPDLDEQRRIATRLDAIARATPRRTDSTVAAIDSLRTALLDESIASAPYQRVGDVLRLERRRVDVATEESYREIGVRSFGRGLFVKEPTVGAQIGGKRVFRVASGDLVVSNIFAWEGAVATAGAGHEGLIGSHRFMTWVPVSRALDVRFARQYLTSPKGLAELRAASPGSAGRNRTLGIAAFSDLRIPVPDVEIQMRAIALQARVDRVDGLSSERTRLAAALLPAARNEEFARLTSA